MADELLFLNTGWTRSGCFRYCKYRVWLTVVQELSAGISHFYCIFVMLFSQERLVNVDFITRASLFVTYITVW